MSRHLTSPQILGCREGSHHLPPLLTALRLPMEEPFLPTISLCGEGGCQGDQLAYPIPVGLHGWSNSGTGPCQSQCDAFPEISQGLDRELQQSRMLSAIGNGE